MTTLIDDSKTKIGYEIPFEQDITLDQLLSSAVAEKLSAMSSVGHLRDRAARGDRDAYQRFLDASPDVPPVPGDEL